MSQLKKKKKVKWVLSVVASFRSVLQSSFAARRTLLLLLLIKILIDSNFALSPCHLIYLSFKVPIPYLMGFRVSDTQSQLHLIHCSSSFPLHSLASSMLHRRLSSSSLAKSQRHKIVRWTEIIKYLSQNKNTCPSIGIFSSTIIIIECFSLPPMLLLRIYPQATIPFPKDNFHRLFDGSNCSTWLDIWMARQWY